MNLPPALFSVFSRKKAIRPDADREELAEASRMRAREGRFPQPVTVATNETQRYKFVARLLAVIAIAETGAILCLSSAILFMLPLKTREPFLIQSMDRSEQVVRVEPVFRSASATNFIAEQQGREHVVMRHAIKRDAGEMQRRWDLNGYMGQHTAEREFQRFRNEAQRGLDQIMQNGITRDVVVNRSSLLRPGLAQVEFTVIDRDANEREFGRQVLVADISYEFREREIRYEQRFINATGFTVTNYQLSLKTQ